MSRRTASPLLMIFHLQSTGLAPVAVQHASMLTSSATSCLAYSANSSAIAFSTSASANGKPVISSTNLELNSQSSKVCGSSSHTVTAMTAWRFDFGCPSCWSTPKSLLVPSSMAEGPLELAAAVAAETAAGNGAISASPLAVSSGITWRDISESMATSPEAAASSPASATASATAEGSKPNLRHSAGSDITQPKIRPRQSSL